MPEIRVDGWRSGIRFDAAHVIPHHPKCGRLHGHTYALHAVVAGDRGRDSGFIVDFGDVKKVLRGVADRLDHHVLVQTKSDEVDVKRDGDLVRVAIGSKTYAFPAADVALLPVEYTSAEDLAAYVLDEVVRGVAWPANVRRIDVGVDEGYGKGVWASRDLP
ncbi:MAG TPA: 6-pyruvoyl tetrahydropterin synthase family protein [Candidatus Thermoplasmatota archaeon]|nr:6-pyruvoyl tetrahydropterin synthase family protein [Candidatus Thermoplasmatota archaeon]